MSLLSVILIDDEEELVSTLKERLEYRNIEAEFVTNGRDAVQRLSERQFDVIILDLKMPGISGQELIEVIKGYHPEIPIIIITGHGCADGDTPEIPQGIFDYLSKPVNIDFLIKKMMAAIESETKHD